MHFSKFEYKNSAIQSQLTICGTDRAYRICLRPNLSTNQPNKKFPNTPPKQNIDTIHDNSSVVNGPLFNGVSSDSNMRKLNDGHPQDVPNETIRRLASNGKNLFFSNHYDQVKKIAYQITRPKTDLLRCCLRTSSRRSSTIENK